MNKYLLSIVIPIYNGQDSITTTLDSFIHDVNENVEIICVNDGSADQTSTTIKKYFNNYPNIKYQLIEQENKGTMIARKVGTYAATGEYVWYIDCGDEAANDAIKTIIETIYETSKECDYYVFNIENRANGHFIKEEHIKEEEIKGCGNLLLYKCSFSMCNKIFKRQHLIGLEVYNYYKRIDSGEDLCVAFELFSKYDKAYLINKTLYIYNIIENSASRKNNEMIIVLKAYDFIKDFIEQKKLDCYSEFYYIVYSKTLLGITKKPIDNYCDEAVAYFNKLPYIKNKYINKRNIYNNLFLIRMKKRNKYLDAIITKLFNK